MSLSSIEKETIILFNEAEPTATVYTCNRALQKHLSDLSRQNTDIHRVRADEYSETYNLPKKWLKVRAPHKLSEDERSKRALRAKENLHKRFDAGNDGSTNDLNA